LVELWPVLLNGINRKKYMATSVKTFHPTLSYTDKQKSNVRRISFAAAALMLITPAVFADDLDLLDEEGLAPEFQTYVEKKKVRIYDGDIVVGAVVPETYELAPVPGVIVTKYPKLKTYRYVRVGKRIAIVSPSTRKVVRFID
jgi:hypothetical protein